MIHGFGINPVLRSALQCGAVLFRNERSVIGEHCVKL